ILFVHDQSTKLLIDIQPSKAVQSYTTYSTSEGAKKEKFKVSLDFAIVETVVERVFTLKVHYVLGVFNTHLALKTYMVGHSVTLVNIIIKSCLDFSFTNLLVKSSTSYFLLVQRYFSYMINQLNFLLIFNQVKQIKAERVFTLKVHYVLGVFNTHLALKTYMVGHSVTLVNIIIKSRLDFSFTNLLVKSSTSYFLLVQRYFSYMINQQNFSLIFNQVKQFKVIPRIQQAEIVFTLKVHYVFGVFNTHLALKTYMVGHFVTLVNIIIKSCLDFSFTNLLVKSSTSYFLLVQRYFSYMINQLNFLLIFNQVKLIKVIPRIQQAEIVFTLKVHYVFRVFNTHLALKTYMVGHFVTLVNIIIKSCLDFSFTNLLVKSSTSYFLLVQRYFLYMINQLNFLLIFNQVKQIKVIPRIQQAEIVFTLKVHYVLGVFNTHLALKTYMVGHFVTLVNIIIKSCLDFSFTNLLVKSSTSYFLLVQRYFSYMINQLNFLLIFNQVKQIKAERVFTLKVHYVLGVFNTHLALKSYMVGHSVTLVNIIIKSHLDFSFTNLLVKSSTSYFLLVQRYFSYMINQQNFSLIFNQVKQFKAEIVFTLKVHYVFGVFNTHLALKTYMVGHFVTLVNIIMKSCLDFSFTNLLVKSSTSYFLLVQRYFSYMINQLNFLLIFNQVKQIKAERVFTLKVHYVLGVFDTKLALKTYMVGHSVTLVNIIIKSRLDFSFTNLLFKSSTSYFLLVQRYFSYMINQQNFSLIFNQVKQIKVIPRIQQAEIVFTLKVHYVFGVFNTHLALKTYMVGHFVTLVNIIMKSCLEFSFTNLLVKSSTSYFLLVQRYFSYMINQLNFLLIFNQVKQIKVERVFTLKVHYVLGVFDTKLALKTYMVGHSVTLVNIIIKARLDFSFTNLLFKSSTSYFLLVQRYFSYMINQQNFSFIFNQVKQIKVIPRIQQAEIVFTLKVNYVFGVFNTHLALKTYMVGHFVTLVNIIMKSCLDFSFTNLLVKSSTSYFLLVQRYFSYMINQLNFLLIFNQVKQIKAERVFILKVHYVLGVFNTHLALKTYMVGHSVTLVNIIIKSQILFVHDQSTKLLIDIQPSKAVQSYTTYSTSEGAKKEKFKVSLDFAIVETVAERVFILKVHYVLGVFNTHLALKTYMVGHSVTLVNIIIKSQILFVHDQSTKLLIDIQPSKAVQSYTTYSTSEGAKKEKFKVSLDFAIVETVAERVFTLKVHYVLGVFNTHLALKTYMVGHSMTLVNIIIKSRLDFSFTNLLVKSSTSYFLLVQRYFSYMINQQNFSMIFNQVKQFKVIPRIQQAERVFTLKVHYVLGVFNTHLALKTYMVGHSVTLVNIIIKSRLDFSFTNLLVKSSTSYFLLVQRYFSYMINQQNFSLIFNQVKQFKVIPRIQQAERVFTLKVHYVLGVFNTHLALKTYMVGHSMTLVNIIIKSRLDFSFTNLLVKSSTSYFLLVQRYFSYMINQQNFSMIFNQVKQFKVIPRIQQAERVFTLKVHYVLGVFNTHLALKTYMVGHSVTLVNIIIKSRLDFSFTNLLVKSSTSYFLLVQRYFSYMINQQNFSLIFNQVKQFKVIPRIQQAERVFTLKVHYVLGVFNTHLALKTYMVGHSMTLVNIIIKSRLDFSFTNLLVKSSTSYFLLVQRYFSYMINQQNFSMIFNQVKQFKVIPRIQQAERVFTLKVHYVLGVFNTHLALKTYMVGHSVTLVNIIIKSRLDFSFTNLLVKSSTSYFLLVQRYFSYMINQQNFSLIFNQVKQFKVIPRIQQAEIVFTLKVHYVFGVFNTHLALKTYMVGHFVTLVNIIMKSCLDFSFTNLLVKSSTSYFLLVQRYFSYMINQLNFLLIFNQVKQIKVERVFTLKVHYVLGVFNTKLALKTYMVGHSVALVNIIIKSRLDFSFTNLIFKSSTSYFLLVQRYFSYMINQQNFSLIFNQVKQIKAEILFTLKVHYVLGVFNTHLALKTYMVGHFVTLVNIIIKSCLDFSFTNLLIKSSTSYFLLVQRYFSYMINQLNFLLIFNQVKQIKAEIVYTLKVHYVLGVFNTHLALKTYMVGHFVTLVNIIIKSCLDFSFTNLLVKSSPSYFLLVQRYFSYMINQLNFLLIFNQVKQIKVIPRIQQAEIVYTLKVHYVLGVFNTHLALKTYMVGHFVTLVNIIIKSCLDFSFTNLLVKSSPSYFLLVQRYFSYMINQLNFLLIFNQVKQIKVIPRIQQVERVFTLKVHYVLGVFDTKLALKTYMVGHSVTLVNIIIKARLDFSFTNLLFKSSTSYFLLVQRYFSYMINQQNFSFIFNQVKQIKVIPRIQQAEIVFTLKVHYVFGVFNTHLALKTYMVGHFVTLVNIIMKSCLDFSFTNLLVKSSTSYFLLVQRYFSYMINQLNFLLIFNQVKQIKAEIVFTLKVHYVFGVFNTHLALKTYMVGHFVTLVNIIMKSCLDFSFTNLLVKSSTSYFLLVQRYFSYMINQLNFLLIFNQVKQIKAERVFTLKVHYVLGVFNTHLALKTYMVGHSVTLVNIIIKSQILFVHDQSTKLLIDIQPSKAVQSYTTYSTSEGAKKEKFKVSLDFAIVETVAERVFTLKVHYVLGVFNTHLALKTYMVGHSMTLVNIIIKSRLDFSFTNLLVKSSTSYFLLVQRYFSYMINQQNFSMIFNQVKQFKVIPRIQQAERVFTLKVHYVLGVFNTHLALKTYMVGHSVTLVNIIIKSRLDFSFTNLLVKSSTSYFLLVQRYFSYMINQQNFSLIFNQVKQFKVIPRIQQAERVFTLKVHYVLGVFNTHLALKTYMVGHSVTLVNIIIKSRLDFSFTNLLVKSSTSYFLLVQRYFSYMINQQNFSLIFNQVKQFKVIPRIQQAERVFTLKVHYVLGVFNTHLALKTYMVGHSVTLVNIIIKSRLDFSFTNLLVKSSTSYFLLVQRYFSYMINQQNFSLIFNQVKQFKVIPRIQQVKEPKRKNSRSHLILP
ncbi:hypothetical protein RYX36_009150, partial [Vicia faba]